MAQVLELLAEFPMFAVRYDPAQNPFFKSIVLENLRQLKGTSVGTKLLKLIEDARPTSRSDFPPNVNIIVEPQPMTFVQSGLKRGFVAGSATDRTLETTSEEKFSPEGCPFYKVGGSQNQAVDTAATDNGQGTVCIMKFTNVEITTTKGEATNPFVVLAHELIHSWHCLYGIRKDGPDEELWTTGIGNFEKHAWNPRTDIDISENIFRDEFGIRRRERYF